MPDPIKNVGQANALANRLKQRGSKTYRYITVGKDANLYYFSTEEKQNNDVASQVRQNYKVDNGPQ